MSVIIPVHAAGDAIEQVVDAVLGQLTDRDELILVADGESDGSWRRYVDDDRVSLLHHTPAHGPAYARNRGARSASGEVLFFVDSDTVLQPGALSTLRAVFDDPHIDAVIGSYDDAPGAPGLMSQYRNLLHHYTHQRSPGPTATFWGACGAVRTTAFAAVEGFDESFGPPSVEDIELGYRLTDASHRIVLEPSIQVKHLKHWGWVDTVRTDVFRRAMPWTRLIRQRGRMSDRNLNLDRRNRRSVAAAGVGVACLAATPVFPPALMGAVAMQGVLLWTNRDFYRFLRSRRGRRFAVASMPCHTLYFLCGGVGFVAGVLKGPR